MNIGEIDAEIKRLEAEDTNYQNCTRLAVLYSIKDHFSANKPAKQADYSYASSEFMQAVTGAPIDAVMAVLDEHMACIEILYPKEYSAIIKRIKALY